MHARAQRETWRVRLCCSGCVVGFFTVTLVLSYSANENFNVTHTQTPGRQIRAVITLSPMKTHEHNDTHTHKHTHACITHSHTRQTNINRVEVSRARTCRKHCALHSRSPSFSAALWCSFKGERHIQREWERASERERETSRQAVEKRGCTTWKFWICFRRWPL